MIRRRHGGRAVVCLCMALTGHAAAGWPASVHAALSGGLVSGGGLAVAGQDGPVSNTSAARWLAAFPWPPGVHSQHVLRGARWQGCPLDAVLFTSAAAPQQLARQLAGVLNTRPGLLLEPETLRMHWYDTGRHQVLTLAAQPGGGSIGSLSSLMLDGCGGAAGQATVDIVAALRTADAASGAATRQAQEELGPRQAQDTARVLLDISDQVAEIRVRQRLYLHDGLPGEIWQAWVDGLRSAGWQAAATEPEAGSLGQRQAGIWTRDRRRLVLRLLPAGDATVAWRLDEETAP
ncbi:hypothetical protein EV679_1346 [Kerstersia gyiorum]|uniref:Uncharacterized protein n=1 Tax=Kerstersia gyiorum TaxID=206506 RepID=A0A4Q7MP16_9BURK|nr:hypothetical protein EV679_1346 [Kerstersia gyiorum]